MLLRVMTLSYCIRFKFVQDHMIIYGVLYKLQGHVVGFY